MKQLEVIFKQQKEANNPLKRVPSEELLNGKPNQDQIEYMIKSTIWISIHARGNFRSAFKGAYDTNHAAKIKIDVKK